MIDAPIGDRSKWKPRWPKLEKHTVPIGQAKVVRSGHDATVVTYGRHVLMAAKVADQLAVEGLSIEVIDLRSLYPYDWKTIKASIEKTGRALFLNEDTEVTNFGEHLAYRTVSELFYELEARPRVLAGKQVPGIGLHPNLEDASVPGLPEIEHELRALIQEEP